MYIYIYIYKREREREERERERERELLPLVPLQMLTAQTPNKNPAPSTSPQTL